MMKKIKCLLAGSLIFLSSTSTFAGVITKAPDLGDYWQPLSSNGTYIYANSFVAPNSGIVSELGLWLNGGSSSLKFQIYGS
ncbi:MAG TPA: hypothetical protein VM532_15355, partial [Burkholderiales bacterium]|nr:hypothetical protein [Burkholderiales bacterium]